MWIASGLGYFSIVKKKGEYYVRARSVQDLELLKTRTGINKDILQFAGTDYIARIIVNDAELKLIQSVLFESITYDNFKNSIKVNPSQKDKTKYYGEVWSVMWEYQLNKDSATLHDKILDAYRKVKK